MGFWEDRTNIAGKVAIVAGGGGGLGRACSMDLGRAGMKVAIADRDAAALEQTAKDLRAEGAEVITGNIDVREPEALEAFFAEVDEAFGALHVLVNVVGGTFVTPFAETGRKGWEAVIRVNFLWLLHSTHLAIPRMEASGGGSIIHITSVEGHRAAPNFAVYSGMKAAIVNFTRSLSLEIAHKGIRVNTLAPDQFPTPNSAHMGGEPGGLDEAGVALTAKIGIPWGRYGNAEDLGGCILFLASDLSRYVTGTSVHVDGGTLASSGWFDWPDEGWRNVPPPPVVQHLQGS
jgi:NAD(P)-dependent dehydrogenase (short-subunit alcohol dehydrogenase family)